MNFEPRAASEARPTGGSRGAARSGCSPGVFGVSSGREETDFQQNPWLMNWGVVDESGGVSPVCGDETSLLQGTLA